MYDIWLLNYVIKIQNRFQVVFKKMFGVSANEIEKGFCLVLINLQKGNVGEWPKHEPMFMDAVRKPVSCTNYVAIWFQPSTWFGSTTWLFLILRTAPCVAF